MPISNPDDTLANPYVAEAIKRRIIKVEENRVTYTLNRDYSYDWTDPEEWVRAATVAWLIIDRNYPANRIRLEVVVPRRMPNDWADILVYRDDACRQPYLVVENKAADQAAANRTQGIEQLFGNANSMSVPLALCDESTESILFDRENFPPTERQQNKLGTRNAVPKQYGDVPRFPLIAGSDNDIKPAPTNVLEAKTRRAHSAIWSGGKRDPLKSFDEWSKLLFAKVIDERTTPDSKPRRFQVGTKETVASVANRIHELFAEACMIDPTVFLRDSRIDLPDVKIAEVVRILQDLSYTRTDVDSIGKAFEQFFGSIFRGGLGQYFTMRQLARFTVGMLEVKHTDYVLDPTAGSGGFLLEVQLQCWHNLDGSFKGQPANQVQRLKIDFALNHVYGIELHDVVARICKINLLLHHDGHTNIEANRSCLEQTFTNPQLNPPREKFSLLVGNPPFGTDIEEGDQDQLGSNSLENFQVATGRRKIDSEQVIVERSIDFLEPDGRLGLVLPDGLLNNQGENSNCPLLRRFLAKNGRIEAIVSLPDHAFRKAGAQNKTSILFFRKFKKHEKRAFDKALASELAKGTTDEAPAIPAAIGAAGLNYSIFLGEADHVGYSPAGSPWHKNDLYISTENDSLPPDQKGSILGEWRKYKADRDKYAGNVSPDCMVVPFDKVWLAHSSNRLDPKYHLFEREAARPTPEGWITLPLSEVMERRLEEMDPNRDADKEFKVMTIAQTGEIRERVAGKGKSPPRWIGAYFEESPGAWYAAHAGDVVYSSIDLWKGCMAFVPHEFDGALVTKEFPIYRVTDNRLLPEFLQCLLRTRYYQRAFRAITTGHSNRRRTQAPDFEALKVSFPADKDEQRRLINRIQSARGQLRSAADLVKQEMNNLSDIIDGRGQQELLEIVADEENGDDAGG
ncbi:MAG TPA: N-6 DNA methylase [Pirellulales bacterium]|nr:N-6 DNA methylase [Pirellulales bacterium]